VDTETTEPEDSSSGTKLATIYVDGSASKGGKSPIGSGLIVYLEGEPHSAHYGLYEPVGTNNIAELNALKAALEKATKLINSGFHVEIRADSEYALKSTSVWAYNWKKKGWKKANSKTPENLALIKECHFLYEDLMDSLSLKHVKAHSGIEGNEVADTLASLAVDKKQRSLIEIPVSEAIPTLR
jgi:ribonuclease HI